MIKRVRNTTIIQVSELSASTIHSLFCSVYANDNELKVSEQLKIS